MPFYGDQSQPKVIVVMPAYNAAKTLKITYEAIPHKVVDQIILVDDGSTDKTLDIARQLQLTVFVHTRNFGYGANQKTCYAEALKEEADIIVMLHPDYQYDPTFLPEIIAPIKARDADIVLGSRFLAGNTLEQGMPWWKFIGNRFLTGLENWTLGLTLAEYQTGYRAYSRRALEQIPFSFNYDNFVFDQVSRRDSYYTTRAIGISVYGRKNFRAPPRAPLRAYTFMEDRLRLPVCRHSRAERRAHFSRRSHAR